MTVKPKRRPIPEFKTIADEAAFWDTHDLADYWDEFTPVKARFAKNLSEGISIRLDTPTLHKLRLEAAQKGVGPTTLARMWIVEHLRQSSAARPARGGRSKGAL